MQKTVYVEGMMCMHCVSHVQKALEAVAGVDAVEVRLDDGLAVVSSAAGVAEDALRDAVTQAGYTVLRVE